MNLKEKIFVITGGSGYIGQAIVKEIILSGGKAIIISRNVRKANNFINKLSPYQKNKCYFIKGDLTKEKDLFRIKKNISKNFRYINGIVNTSRGSLAGLPLADLLYAIAMARILEKKLRGEITFKFLSHDLEYFYK